MKFGFSAVCLGVESRPYKDNVYYTIHLKSGQEFTSMDCTAEVANVVEDFKSYDFVGEYAVMNTQKGQFKRIGVVAAVLQRS